MARSSFTFFGWSIDFQSRNLKAYDIMLNEESVVKVCNPDRIMITCSNDSSNNIMD